MSFELTKKIQKQNASSTYLNKRGKRVGGYVPEDLREPYRQLVKTRFVDPYAGLSLSKMRAIQEKNIKGPKALSESFVDSVIRLTEDKIKTKRNANIDDYKLILEELNSQFKEIDVTITDKFTRDYLVRLTANLKSGMNKAEAYEDALNVAINNHLDLIYKKEERDVKKHEIPTVAPGPAIPKKRMPIDDEEEEEERPIMKKAKGPKKQSIPEEVGADRFEELIKQMKQANITSQKQVDFLIQKEINKQKKILEDEHIKEMRRKEKIARLEDDEQEKWERANRKAYNKSGENEKWFKEVDKLEKQRAKDKINKAKRKDYIEIIDYDDELNRGSEQLGEEELKEAYYKRFPEERPTLFKWIKDKIYGSELDRDETTELIREKRERDEQAKKKEQEERKKELLYDEYKEKIPLKGNLKGDTNIYFPEMTKNVPRKTGIAKSLITFGETVLEENEKKKANEILRKIDEEIKRDNENKIRKKESKKEGIKLNYPDFTFEDVKFEPRKNEPSEEKIRIFDNYKTYMESFVEPYYNKFMEPYKNYMTKEEIKEKERQERLNKQKKEKEEEDKFIKENKKVLDNLYEQIEVKRAMEAMGLGDKEADLIALMYLQDKSGKEIAKLNKRDEPKSKLDIDLEEIREKKKKDKYDSPIIILNPWEEKQILNKMEKDVITQEYIKEIDMPKKEATKKIKNIINDEIKKYKISEDKEQQKFWKNQEKLSKIEVPYGKTPKQVEKEKRIKESNKKFLDERKKQKEKKFIDNKIKIDELKIKLENEQKEYNEELGIKKELLYRLDESTNRNEIIDLERNIDATNSYIEAITDSINSIKKEIKHLSGQNKYID